MENRGTHNGTKCFVKSVSKNNFCKYVMSELTMRMADGDTRNVYMVECIYYDDSIGCTFMYETYKKACEMVEYFLAD